MAREDVNIKVNANVAEAIQLWKAMEQGPEGMAKSLEGMGSRGKSAAKGIGDAMAAAAGKFVSIGAAIAGVTSALRDMEAQAKAAADRASGSLGAAGELAQVASSAGDYQRLLAESRRLVAQGVFAPGQESAAMQMVFAQTSAGFSDKDRAFLASLGKSRLVRPEALSEFGQGLAKVRDVYGADEAGDLSAIGAKVLQASQATQSSASQFSTAATRFGSGAVALGYSDEESFAAAAAIEKGSANIDEAATRLAALFTSIEKSGLSRGSLGQTMDALSMRVQAGGDVRALLGGRQEAIAGFRAFEQQRDFYREQLGLISSAPQRNVIGTAQSYIESDPATAAALRKAASEGQYAAAYDPEAEGQLLYDAFQSEMQASYRKRYGRFIGGAVNAGFRFGTGITDFFGAEEAEFRALPERQWNQLSPELRKSIQGYLNRDSGGEPSASAGQGGGEIRIRIMNHDGRDLPHEVEAAAINGGQ